jgi:hypothetical protein
MIVSSSAILAASINNTVITLPLVNYERPHWLTQLNNNNASISLSVRRVLSSSPTTNATSTVTSIGASTLSSSSNTSNTPRSGASTRRGSNTSMQGEADNSRSSATSINNDMDGSTSLVSPSTTTARDNSLLNDARSVLIEGAIFTRYTFLRTPSDAARRKLIWYEPSVISTTPTNGNKALHAPTAASSSSSTVSSVQRASLGYLHGTRVPTNGDTSSIVRQAEGKSISLDAIRVIACGKAAGKALSTKVAASAIDSCCLVVIAGTGGNERRMELEATSRQIRDNWVRSLCCILDYNNRSYTLQGASSMSRSRSSSNVNGSSSGVSPTTLANRRAKYATMRGTQIPSTIDTAAAATSINNDDIIPALSSPSPSPSASPPSSLAASLGPGELGLRAMIEGRSFLLYWPDAPPPSLTSAKPILGALAAVAGESERCDVWLRREPSSRGIAAGQGPTLFWSKSNSRSQLAGNSNINPLGISISYHLIMVALIW